MICDVGIFKKAHRDHSPSLFNVTDGAIIAASAEC